MIAHRPCLIGHQYVRPSARTTYESCRLQFEMSTQVKARKCFLDCNTKCFTGCTDKEPVTFLDRLPGEAKEVIDKALVKPHSPWGVLPQNKEKALSSFQEPEEETVASGAQTMISVGKETDVDDVKRR